ncbi:MAG: acetolactate synthase large subunit, partial [Treponema sp.]|nr:acetolactate synthase large subunit [Treponema sp.]
PGPVLIDIPSDICAAETKWKPAVLAAWEDGSALGARATRLTERSERVTFGAADIDRAAELILSARRPLIYAGGGANASGASAELLELSGRLNAPVALSLMGIGAVPRDYRLCTGLVGMHGTVASNKAVQKADLVVAAGARFSDRVTSRADHFARNAKILHLDIDPAEVNKNIPSDFCVTGDLKKILTAILKKLPLSAETAWNGEIEKLKESDARHSAKREKGLHPRFIVEETAKKTGFDAVVVTDVGQHQMWAARYYPVSRPRSFITSGGLGAMGFGLGAAIGAKLANPERPVVLFTGDGSFRMNSCELATVSRYGIPVLIVLINNGVLGMVRQWQKLFCGGVFSETELGQAPDFPVLANAYRISGFRATTPEEFSAALDRAAVHLAENRPALVEAFIDKNEMVLPMVPGGRPVDEQIL